MDDSINHYRNETLAITGASGYLASVLIDALKKTPARILRISRRDLHPISGTVTLKADVRVRDCWKEIISRADIIFHLAGNTSVYAAAKDPADSLNSTVLPITHLVAAAQAAGRAPRVVFASTATVYGLTESLPVAEDAEPKPITNYDLHKLYAEKQLELASRQGILEGVSLRLANVYGPSSSNSSADDRGVLNRITRMALQGVNFRLYGDGDYVRDYVYIDDVVRAFIAAGAKKGVVARSFNVASGKGITVREAFHLVAERAERVTGKRVSIENTPWPKNADPIEFRNFVADITGLQNSAGWHPIISLKQGVDRMIECFSNDTRFK
jgi:nucleoside-diphosphate-sugar epimerase